MFNKFLKILVVLGIFYQTPLYSKSASFNEFNSRDLSNYFSGIIAFENKDNYDALKFFNASKVLLNKHDAYLKRYSFSLVLENKVAQAINVIKNSVIARIIRGKTTRCQFCKLPAACVISSPQLGVGGCKPNPK